jgi:hypothetical protein
MDTGTEVAMEGATCIVQEEFPEEFLYMAPDTYIHPSTNEVVTGAAEGYGGIHLHYARGIPHLDASTTEHS